MKIGSKAMKNVSCWNKVVKLSIYYSNHFILGGCYGKRAKKTDRGKNSGQGKSD